MSTAALLLSEFDREAKTTRKLFERVSDASFAWKPHPKSASLMELTAHLAHLPPWTGVILSTSDFDAMAPESKFIHPPVLESTAQLLAHFDREVAAAHDALAKANDDDLRKTWTLRVGARTLFTQEKAHVMRGFVLSHTYHHRGQLTVYLRLLDVALPSVYGPTADAPF